MKPAETLSKNFRLETWVTKRHKRRNKRCGGGLKLNGLMHLFSTRLSQSVEFRSCIYFVVLRFQRFPAHEFQVVNSQYVNFQSTHCALRLSSCFWWLVASLTLSAFSSRSSVQATKRPETEDLGHHLALGRWSFHVVLPLAAPLNATHCKATTSYRATEQRRRRRLSIL